MINTEFAYTAGSGRLTLRNRRFLKKITPYPQSQSLRPDFQPISDDCLDNQGETESQETTETFIPAATEDDPVDNVTPDMQVEDGPAE